MGLQNIKHFCKDNANSIFTGLAIVCSIGAIVEAVHATAKACHKIGEAQYDKWEELGEPEDPGVDISLTPKETIKLVWSDYILTGVLTIGTISFELLALRAGQKKIEAAVGSSILASQMVTALRESMKENLSKKDISKVENGVVHKMIADDKKSDKTRNVMEALRSKTDTHTIYRDAYSARGCGLYFTGDVEQLNRAVNLYNHILSEAAHDGLKATLNEWYDCLSRCGINIGRSDCGDFLEFDWDTDGPMDLYYMPDIIDPNYETELTVAIGLRRADSAMTDLALPSTPHSRHGYLGG